GIEREDLAAIRTRGVDRTLQLGETALHEFRAMRARRHGNLDPGSGLPSVFTVGGEQDRVAKVTGLAKPHSIIETFYRRVLADIHFLVLRRRDRRSVAIFSAQRRDRHRLIA